MDYRPTLRALQHRLYNTLRPLKAKAREFLIKVRRGAYLKTPEFWLTFAAYAIPLSFLLYVLYWNFLPFGYNKIFVIDVGTEGDTSGEFYLEPSRDLSERKTAEDGTTYRELNGIAYAVFKPKAVLKDAEITIEVEGEGVEIIPPVIDFDPDSVEWDYSWDFTQGKTPEELGLTGNAFPFDGAMYFDGKSRLELPDSADKFEDGPFTVYAEWTPTDSENDFQQILGHYNWELLQNSDSVTFQVGRMGSSTGPFYSIRYPVEPEFFNTKHTALAVYSPASTSTENGYIELYVDDNFVDRIYFEKENIWNEYNRTRNLTIAKSDHGAAKFLAGSTYKTYVINQNVFQSANKLKLVVPEINIVKIAFVTNQPTELNNIDLNAVLK